MGLLDGGAAALFGEIFAPLFLPATVYEMTVTNDPRGDPQRAEFARPCLAQVDAATERMRTQPDFASSDRALFVLAASFDGTLTSDHEIAVLAGPFAGTRWKVAAPIDRDPAGAYWLARGVLGK